MNKIKARSEVDNKYKLGGNVNLVNFTYYYE